MTLSELLISAGGIGIVVKLLMDIVKAVAPVKGRSTQGATVALAVVLALVGALYYAHSKDIPQALWLGLQAGAAAIGIDQVTKKQV